MHARCGASATNAGASTELTGHLNGDTRALIGAQFLSILQPTAEYFIALHTPVVGDAARVAAKVDPKIAGAGFHVIHTEPQRLANPLLAYQQRAGSTLGDWSARDLPVHRDTSSPASWWLTSFSTHTNKVSRPSVNGSAKKITVTVYTKVVPRPYGCARWKLAWQALLEFVHSQPVRSLAKQVKTANN